MCGIGGQFAYHGQALSEDLAPLERMSLRMRPRGPDGSGMFVSDDRRIGLVHRRLAIIDLSEAGKQPMAHKPSLGLVAIIPEQKFFIGNVIEKNRDEYKDGRTHWSRP